MAREHVHCVLVHDDADRNDFRGLVSDVAVAEAASRGRVREPAGAWLDRIAVVPGELTVESAFRRMSERGTANLLVVDPLTGRAVGVVSRLDAADALLLSHPVARAA